MKTYLDLIDEEETISDEIAEKGANDDSEYKPGKAEVEIFNNEGPNVNDSETLHDIFNSSCVEEEMCEIKKWVGRRGTMDRSNPAVALEILTFLSNSKFNIKRTENSPETIRHIMKEFVKNGIEYKCTKSDDKHKFHQNLRSWIVAIYRNLTKIEYFDNKEYRETLGSVKFVAFVKSDWKSTEKNDSAKLSDPRTKRLLQEVTNDQRVKLAALAGNLCNKDEYNLPDPVTSISRIPKEVFGRDGKVDLQMKKRRKRKEFNDILRKKANDCAVRVAKMHLPRPKDSVPKPNIASILSWLQSCNSSRVLGMYDVRYELIIANLESNYTSIVKYGDPIEKEIFLLKIVFMAAKSPRTDAFDAIEKFLRPDGTEEEQF